MKSLFVLYDLNKDGVLDKAEVAAMMETMEFEVDDDYLQQVTATFGRFDEDGSGEIDFSEFEPLWRFLGGCTDEHGGGAGVDVAGAGGAGGGGGGGGES